MTAAVAVADAWRNFIQKSIQLLGGRITQEYNQRKKRKGALWEDKYLATAIERGSHLVQCIVSIDMNMVYTSVVNHLPYNEDFTCKNSDIRAKGIYN